MVDGTFGGGGHSEEILKRILPGGRLIAIDKDLAAIERGKERFGALGNRVTFVHDDFKNIRAIVSNLDIHRIDGAILDLGVSSYQLDDGSRGFSYNFDAKLDMRMNTEDRISAFDIVNTYSEDKLHRMIAEYGEEKWAKRIAQFIVRARSDAPIETTFKLCEVIKNAIPASARAGGSHPAKRTFQAIRIEVNGELGGLYDSLIDYADITTTGGRICVITFHSLEDRLVKQGMKHLDNPCECPPGMPKCVCGKVRKVKIITKKPVLPSTNEVDLNNRARSAKLRVCEVL